MKKFYGNAQAKAEGKSAFTLAEVLITLAIIGVVAAIAIPSVISNSQQQEFKTGLRKAVSVLNSAITMNMALDGETPYDNKDTFNYLKKHMNILKTTQHLPYQYRTRIGSGDNAKIATSNGTNAAFYTTDGMRFEVDDSKTQGNSSVKLHESNVYVCTVSLTSTKFDEYGNSYHDNTNNCNGCGSYGLNSNPNNTTEPPCLILVDVNGDRKPSPSNINCNDNSCMKNNFYTYPLSNSNKVTDIFAIMITEDRAVPFGVVAQKAMYNGTK